MIARWKATLSMLAGWVVERAQVGLSPLSMSRAGSIGEAFRLRWKPSLLDAVEGQRHAHKARDKEADAAKASPTFSELLILYVVSQMLAYACVWPGPAEARAEEVAVDGFKRAPEQILPQHENALADERLHREGHTKHERDHRAPRITTLPLAASLVCSKPMPTKPNANKWKVIILKMFGVMSFQPVEVGIPTKSRLISTNQ